MKDVWVLIRPLLLKIVIIVACVWIVFTFIFAFHIQSGNDMYPRLMDGDLLFLYRLDKEISLNDVIVFEKDGETYTGRIVAQAGDTVDFSEDGGLIVNNSLQSEEIFYETMISDDYKENYPMVVPNDSYYILCDFRTEAIDSRTYGTVSTSEYIGTVIGVFRRRVI